MKQRRNWDIIMLSLLIFLYGVLNIASAISPALPARIYFLQNILPHILIHGSRHLVSIIGFILILLAWGIYKRKRIIWYISLILLILSSVLHLLKGLDYEEAFIAAVLILFMFMERRRFRARSNVPTIAKAFLMLFAVLGLNILYGVLGFYFISRYVGASLSAAECFRVTLDVMFTSRNDLFNLPYHHVHWFLNSLWLIWEGALVLFTFMLLRPYIYKQTTLIPDQQRASGLAEQYGRSSLVYFTLWPDKRYFFNNNKTVYIAYAQVGEIAVALGDPVGPENEIAAAILEYLELCHDNGWIPAFYQVLPDHLTDYRRAGLRMLHIGDEAIVDLHHFSMEGKKFKTLRNIKHRFEREGYHTVWYDIPLENHIITELEKVSNEWLNYQGGEEKGFSLGWFDPELIKTTPVVTVETAAGEILAFANYVPMYTLPQASPDLMRYSRKAPAGIMDYLFIESLLHFQGQGIAGFNLGLAPLAHVGVEESTTIAERAINALYENFYNFKGLYNFKAKFAPCWEPRFLIYPQLISLPRITLAVIRADNPSGMTKFWRLAKIKIKSYFRG